jgi:DNA-binding response OmpR family regulator
MQSPPVSNIALKKILLIDDEIKVREVVALCLADLGGWDVFIADSALNGFSMAVHNRPDLIVLDLSHDMSILAFMKQLRNNLTTQTIPVVVLSAKTKWLNSQMRQKYQVTGSILKPFDPFKFTVEIATIMDWDLTQSMKTQKETFDFFS